MPKILNPIFSWIPLAIAITMMSALVYVSVQQVYRTGADDPQLEYVHDVSKNLFAGAEPTQIINPEFSNLDVADTTSPFVAIYDAEGKLVVANAKMDGEEMRNPPIGVFEYTKAHGEHRVTWQPQEDIRIAAVITYVAGETPYYVLSGRSLQEVESRIANLGRMVLIGWASTLLITLLAHLGIWLLRGRK